MLDIYTYDFENIIYKIFFITFISVLILLVILLIISLLLLILGCLIKSQKIKSKFLVTIPTLIVGEILLLALPYLVVHIKNLV